jgi:hypothetical protein
METVHRPSEFRIHKRNTFTSMKEYFTIHYYNLIYELENIESKGYARTTIRIATFSGGGDQLYYAHLDVPSDAHYRTGSIVKVKIGSPNDDDKRDWKFHIIEPLGFTNANEYSGFLFRPRHDATFVADPEF